MDKLKFEVKDARGWQVSCTQERWSTHIQQRHPELDEDDVLDCIKKPSHGIYRDAGRPYTRLVYYHQVSGKDYYLKVVAEIVADEQANVVTAYRASRQRPGEVKIWPTSNRS